MVMLMLAAPLWGASPAAPATQPRNLLAQGSRDMYWIARIMPQPQDQSGKPSVQSLIQCRRIGGDPNWKLIAQIRSSRVISLANRGQQLAALFETGDWMLIWDGGSSTGPLPEDNARLTQLAGSEQALFAIAISGQGRTPTSAASTRPVATLPAGSRLLYRMDQGRWKFLTTLPPAAQQPLDLSLAVVDGRPVLAALLSGGEVRAYTLNDAADSWESTGVIDAGPGVARIKVLPDLDRLALWTFGDGGLSRLFVRDVKWQGPIVLSSTRAADANVHGQIGDMDVAVAGQNIRLLSIAPDNKLFESSFASDGSSRGQGELPMPAPAMDQRPFDWLSAIAAGMLMVVLLHSVRRRDTTSPQALKDAGLKLAPHGRRLLAGSIDALPVIGTLVLTAARMDPDQLPSLEAAWMAMHIPWEISIAVYVLVTIVSEWAWGWTIGKRLCGLRVVMLDGSSPTARAIWIRNLLRVIDAVMLLPLVLVFISPLRQRVGDIPAKTLVVLADRK